MYLSSSYETFNFLLGLLFWLKAASVKFRNSRKSIKNLLSECQPNFFDNIWKSGVSFEMGKNVIKISRRRKICQKSQKTFRWKNIFCFSKYRFLNKRRKFCVFSESQIFREEFFLALPGI